MCHDLAGCLLLAVAHDVTHVSLSYTSCHHVILHCYPSIGSQWCTQLAVLQRAPPTWTTHTIPFETLLHPIHPYTAVDLQGELSGLVGLAAKACTLMCWYLACCWPMFAGQAEIKSSRHKQQPSNAHHHSQPAYSTGRLHTACKMTYWLKE
jgi:hypothetical protein